MSDGSDECGRGHISVAFVLLIKVWSATASRMRGCGRVRLRGFELFPTEGVKNPPACIRRMIRRSGAERNKSCSENDTEEWKKSKLYTVRGCGVFDEARTIALLSIST